MSSSTDVDFLVLHGLAVKKAGTAAAVADVLGEDPGRVAAALETSVESGRAVEAGGTFMATPAGREWLVEEYGSTFGQFRGAPEASEAYERFERINRDLLRLFTEWQMMPAGNESVPNDPCIIWKTSLCSLSGVQRRISPSVVTTSYSKHAS